LKVILIVVGIFVALIVLMGACVAAIGGDDTAAPPPPSEESTASEPKPEGSQPPAEKTYKIGDKATDDDYQFTVTKIKCGVSRVGDTYSNEKAQGQFCLVSLRIKNVGNDPISYSSENQALVDTKGKNYSPDDEAWIYVDDSDVWGEINPGNTLKTIVPFDVPKKTKPDHLLLKAGVWGASDGVIVKV
jgi:archaellum component FlaG (FlaF/FlaG flagellin family)